MNKEEKINYSSGDGIKLVGIFDLADKTTDFALMAHGIGMDKNEWNNLHFRISKDLNKQSISTFRFDYRGHGESQGTIREMTIIGEFLDVKSSIQQVEKKWKNKISIVASSFGAGSCILYCYLYPEKIETLILLNPVLDYDATFLHPIVDWAKTAFTEKGYANLEKLGYIKLDEYELDAKLIAEFQTLKPFEWLKMLKCPVLVVHGDEDSMVPYSISKKYGTPNRKSKFIRIKHAEHGFIESNDEEGISKKSMRNQQQVTEHIINWIKK